MPRVRCEDTVGNAGLLSLPTRVAVAAPCGMDASGHHTRPRHPHNRPTACVVRSLRQVPTGFRSGGAPDTPTSCTSCDRVWYAVILPARPKNPAQPTHSGRPGNTRRMQRLEKAMRTIEQPHTPTPRTFCDRVCHTAVLAAPHPPPTRLLCTCGASGIQQNSRDRTRALPGQDTPCHQHIQNSDWELARGCTPSARECVAPPSPTAGDLRPNGELPHQQHPFELCVDVCKLPHLDRTLTAGGGGVAPKLDTL